MYDYKFQKYQYKFFQTNDHKKKNKYLDRIVHYQKKMAGGVPIIQLMTPKPIESKENYALIEHLFNAEKIPVRGWGITEVGQEMMPMEFERRAPRTDDVVIKILYCGVCLSDWHDLKGEWPAKMPLIAGHEIVGRIVRTGDEVKKFGMEDLVMVGPYVNSCRICTRCKEEKQQYCENIASWTYNGRDRNPGDILPEGEPTYGGFSNAITVNQDFVFKLPENLPPDVAAPLADAGLTTFSALTQAKVGPGVRVGVAGIGGLGHMAVKLARAMGAYVLALTTTEWKLADSKRIGANDSVLVTNDEDLQFFRSTLNVIIDTIPTPHDFGKYIDLLAFDGVHWVLGYFDEMNLDLDMLASMNKSVKSSIIGGTNEMLDMLDFCSKHLVVADIEKIPIDKINGTYEGMVNSRVRYRYVVDMAGE